MNQRIGESIWKIIITDIEINEWSSGISSIQLNQVNKYIINIIWQKKQKQKLNWRNLLHNLILIVVVNIIHIINSCAISFMVQNVELGVNLGNTSVHSSGLKTTGDRPEADSPIYVEDTLESKGCLDDKVEEILFDDDGGEDHGWTIPSCHLQPGNRSREAVNGWNLHRDHIADVTWVNYNA